MTTIKPVKSTTIRDLPDDVLLSIVSCLTAQEAAVTSSVSYQWMHVHKYVTRPNFDIPKPKKGTRQFKEHDQKKFNMICHVLKNHKCDLYELRIRSILSLKGVNIDEWFAFALSKRLEILEINLDLYPDRTHGRHLFPIEYLIEKKGISSLLAFGTLKELTLIHVDMNARAVELLLSNCTVLERLLLSFSKRLGRKLSVVGCPSLKHLEIYDQATKSTDDQVSKFVEIRNSNIVSFKYRGQSLIDLIADDSVPKLIEIDMEYSISDAYLKFLRELWCCIHQLMHLCLMFHPVTSKSEMLRNWLEWSRMPINTIPKLTNLKHLVLDVLILDEPYLIGLTPLIEASPFLERLDVKFSRSKPASKRRPAYDTKILKQPHYNLQKVTFSGYSRSPDEVGFAKYISLNAVKLQVFVVNREKVRSNVGPKQTTVEAKKQFREEVKLQTSVKLIMK